MKNLDLEKEIDNSAQKDYDIDAVALKNQQTKLQLERFGQDTKDRKWLAYWSVSVVSFWLLSVLLILVFNQFLALSDAVLITLLTTTTLNILGLTFIVLKGHFNALR